MVGDHIYLNIGGIFSLKPFNLTGIAGGLLFISLSFDEPLLKQYNEKDGVAPPSFLGVQKCMPLAFITYIISQCNSMSTFQTSVWEIRKACIFQMNLGFSHRPARYKIYTRSQKIRYNNLVYSNRCLYFDSLYILHCLLPHI